MKDLSLLTRRSMLALGAIPLLANASTWPDRPIKLLVAATAGTQPDIFARIYADQLSAALKVPVVVDNRSGAAGNIGANAAAMSAPDGYTFLYAIANVTTMNQFLYTNIPFDPIKDLAPVAEAVNTTTMLLASNSAGVNTVAEAIALARSRKGELVYGSYGVGGYPHLVFVQLLQKAGVEMLHVPYRTGALTDLITGRIQFLLEPTATAIPQIRAGKVKALAHSGSRRHPEFPALPTIAETVPGVVLEGWHGFYAPAGTPAAIIERVSAEINRINEMPEIKERLLGRSGTPVTGSPKQMAARIEKESKGWEALIRANNIKVE
ncbi:tripartite tricarboxylate transporter substrate binding protein [Ottowia caeni]|uniref:Bug family tripartite tricarboxylate transporter substrate binding protein n=1 Tax=Ottowia caeni TaxID=2870339 RepID=UPI001E32E629|nr:tripartite tricarboxylate transporter substrate binding protein [Ottowia caeni]